MKNLLLAATMCLAFSSAAFAEEGNFYCETNPGTRAFDGTYISGSLDGEAQVTNLVVVYAEGDGIAIPLEMRSLDLFRKFSLVAVERLEDESTIIKVKASKINGKSRASFSFQNGESIERRKGFCEVSFKAGK